MAKLQRAGYHGPVSKDKRGSPPPPPRKSNAAPPPLPEPGDAGKETRTALHSLQSLREVEIPDDLERIDLDAAGPEVGGAAASGPRTWTKESPEVPNTGRLEGYRLADVLHHCSMYETTGILTLQRKGHQKKIYLERGAPVYVQSSLQHETLGAFLLKRKVIDEEQHKTSIETMQSTGKRHAEVLIGMGVITPKQAMQYLNAHIQFKAIGAFAWTEGTYAIEEYAELPQEVMVLRMNPCRVVVDGLRGHFRPDNLPDDFPALDSTVGVALDDPSYTDEELELSKRAARVRADLEAGKGADSIAKTLDVAVEQVMGIAFALYSLQVMGLTDRPPEPHEDSDDGEDLSDEIDLGDADVESVNEEIDEFLADYVRMRSLDCFELLDVSTEATDEQVALAFKRLHEKFHPSTFGDSTGLDVGDKIGELWARIVRAHETLKTAEGRRDYADSLGDASASGSSWTPDRTDALTAEQHFQAGKAALQKEQYAAAAKAFDQALRRAPMEPAYLCHHGWTLYLADRELNRERSVEELSTALSLDPGYAGAYFFLGRIAMMEDNHRLAASHFDAAMRADPDNIEAKRYHHIASQRREASPDASKAASSGGAFRRLFRRR